MVIVVVVDADCLQASPSSFHLAANWRRDQCVMCDAIFHIIDFKCLDEIKIANSIKCTP